ncbi:hypothetical protein Bsp3421_001556 [Burkholderia sp. FERM BP-3421]|uniref:MmyB family transcriptional regulator n=1 Tax=Burkholderia sp. FERM BP-3421 TaxID=1494466 RepID=UPI002362EB59|nr:hypothetical protein [Burkholderia sp. FERM BP-3421]WDD91620.1 hypothetical protein Bsp3421_001556 [Burkholderia sp. FERM BP-3421]
MAIALVGEQTRYTGLNRSIIYRWFTDPDQRRIYHPDDHEAHSRRYVASLRAVHGRSADDSEADEFAALWKLHEVADRRRKRYVHPLVGILTLDCVMLTSADLTERLTIFTAAPGSPDADRLKLLSVVDAQHPDPKKAEKRLRYQAGGPTPTKRRVVTVGASRSREARRSLTAYRRSALSLRASALCRDAPRPAADAPRSIPRHLAPSCRLACRPAPAPSA